jgi:hypothetical protein
MSDGKNKWEATSWPSRAQLGEAGNVPQDSDCCFQRYMWHCSSRTAMAYLEYSHGVNLRAKSNSHSTEAQAVEESPPPLSLHKDCKG